MRNAKIVCTLGPATEDRATIGRLADAGMTVARVNASHGTRTDRAALIDRAQAVDDDTDKPVAVMVDLQGPEVRTGAAERPVELETGRTVVFEEGETITTERVGLSTDISSVEPGDRILLDDGLIETRVTGQEGQQIHARVESGGILGSHKGVNVPGVALDLEVITEQDRADLELAVDAGVDFVAASFVRDADDVLAVGKAIESLGAEIPVVAKIERADAVDHLEEIISAAQGVMVARGDLGVELPMEDVPLIQKRIIRKAQTAGVPVITATEMLDSMVEQARPTRAEASDVANAVLDGTDAVMLSAETAVGDHPIRVVKTMDRIVREIEASQEYADIVDQRVPPAAEDSRTDALARSARYLARDLRASAVVVATESGFTARRAAKFRPRVPIVAATPSDSVRRQLGLVDGVHAQYAEVQAGTATTVVQESVRAALDSGVIEPGDTVVVLVGMMTELEGEDTTNTLKVHVAAETLAVGRAVVDGRAAGPVVELDAVDLTDVESGSIGIIRSEFEKDLAEGVENLGGIVSGRSGMTSYAAMVARELGIPMISGADVTEFEAGRTVTVDGERGVVYDGDVTDARTGPRGSR
ncbi:MAG: pyruvate kinase [Halodesulfurarchaeum sp.]